MIIYDDAFHLFSCIFSHIFIITIKQHTITLKKQQQTFHMDLNRFKINFPRKNGMDRTTGRQDDKIKIGKTEKSFMKF